MLRSQPDSLGSAPVLKRRRIAKSFEAVRDLSAVTVTAFPGKAVGSAEESRAAKSTPLQVLGGGRQPDASHIVIDPYRVTLNDPHHPRDLPVRIVHETPAIVGWATVAENLNIGEPPRTRASRYRGSALLNKAQRLPNRIGVDAVSPGTLESEFSATHRRLVEFAKATKRGLRALALEEPTSSRAQDHVERFLPAARLITPQGVGVLDVGRHLREVLALANELAILRDGHLVELRPTVGPDQDEHVRPIVGKELTDIFPSRYASRTGKIVLSARKLRSDSLNGVDIDVRRARALVGEFSVSKDATLSVLRRLWRFCVARRKQHEELARTLVETLDVKPPSIDQGVPTLSGVGPRKLALAPWHAVQPRLLIGARPTTGFDVGARSVIYHLARRLADNRASAVLFIGRELPEVLGPPDRIPVTRHGSIVGDAYPESATGESLMRIVTLADDSTPVQDPPRTQGVAIMISTSRGTRTSPARAPRSGWSEATPRVASQNVSLILALVMLLMIVGSWAPDLFLRPAHISSTSAALWRY